MANNKNKEGLLDDFLNIITKDVRTFAIFMVTVASLIVSTAALLVAIAVCLVLKMLRLPIITFAVIIISLMVIAIGWYFYHANYLVLQYHNKILWLSILHGQKFIVMRSPQLWLYAAPYGFLLGGLMQLMIKPSGSALQKEVETLLKCEEKRTTQKLLSEKNLQRKLAQLKCAHLRDSTILGVDRNTGETIALLDSDANLNTLVVGTTGCGKTTALSNLMESTIARRMPLFYIDGKGDLPLAEKLEQFAKAHKVPFYRFSMLGQSDKYNPLASGGFTAKKDRIIALREWTEAHYRKIAEGYLQTVFKVLTAANIAIDLSTLSQYCEPTPLGILARKLNQPELSQEVHALASKRKDIESLIAEIENIAKSELGHLFDCSEGKVIELRKAISEKAVIYVGLQPLAFPSYAETLGKLFINDLKSLLSEQLRQSTVTPIPLMLLFDEFSLFAGEQIINLINQGRSAGAHAVLSTQSLSDITAKGGQALLGQVLNNVNNFIILRQNFPADAEMLASVVGTCDNLNISAQISAEDGALQGGGISRMKSYIIHPDEIKRLELGEAIFMNKAKFLVQRVKLRRGRIG
jgi:conjugal transfer pilus assembly protein TraD